MSGISIGSAANAASVAKTSATPDAEKAEQAAKAKKAAADGAKKADLKKAADGFEAILVKSMLATAKVGGKGEYADMGVDALSTAVTQGGGLGLAGAIERAIGGHDHAAPPAAAHPKKT